MEEKIKKMTHEEIKSGRPDIETVKKSPRFPVCVLCENIRSLYNVGSIFRTSDGANIEKLYLCGYTGYPPRKEIDKTALGSVDSVPWERVEDPAEVITDLRARGYRIIALEHTDRSIEYDKMEYDYPLLLVLGNEVDGVSDEITALCDMAVEIPMYGLKQSLNVSVAYGIVIYQIVRKYLSPIIKPGV